MKKVSTIAISQESASRWSDYSQLVKLKLTLMVVFTSFIGYLIATNGVIEWGTLSLLLIGGFMITCASNAMNEVLEKDFDALMKRTENRPLPQGRMTSSEAVVFAGLMCVVAIFLLALINPLTALLGAMSFVLYAFVYTPMKRISSISVLIGAIPGALPAAIGFVAHDGTLSTMAFILFSIQFIWQMPHFWAIGWLGYEDYEKAGYVLLPKMHLGKTREIGKQAFIYALFLIPISLTPWYYDFVNLPFTLLVLLGAGWYIYKAWRFYQQNDKESARGLLFGSLYYLPLVFTVLLIGSII